MYGQVGQMDAGRVLRRRRARITFGVVLISVVPVLGWLVASGLFISTWNLDRYTVHALGILWLGALGAAALVYALPVRVIGRGARAGATTPASALSSADGTAYEAERLKAPSLVVPAIGLGLASPLSLHAVVATLLEEGPQHFDDWVRVSVVLVGFAHLVFAWALTHQAQKLARDPFAGSAFEGAAKTVLLASAAACMPGAVALLVPPVLTFFTGGILAPIILVGLRTAAQREAVRPPPPASSGAASGTYAFAGGGAIDAM